VVLYLLSGTAKPVENMSELIERIVQVYPTMQMVKMTQTMLARQS
jgi:hypothetical protein